MAKMTKAQAWAVIEKQVGTAVEAGYKLTEANKSKVKKLTEKLKKEMGKAESPEAIDLIAKGLRLQMRGLADGVTKISDGFKTLKKLSENEELFALVSDELTDAITKATDELEDSRNALRAAKEALDKATKVGEELNKDNDAASEEWAAAVTNFDRITSAAIAESKEWDDWSINKVPNAVAARDKAGLAKLLKAKPARKALDEFAALPKDKPFDDFDKAFDVPALSPDLQAEIKRDRAKAMTTHKLVAAVLVGVNTYESEAAAVVIEPRDVDKALKALDWPTSIKGKLTPVLNGPDKDLPKGLETLAKSLNKSTKGAILVTTLKLAKVL
ncbi:MAG: hypothetical protein ACKVQR_16255 [Aquabacterium sp.]